MTGKGSSKACKKILNVQLCNQSIPVGSSELMGLTHDFTCPPCDDMPEIIPSLMIIAYIVPTQPDSQLTIIFEVQQRLRHDHHIHIHRAQDLFPTSGSPMRGHTFVAIFGVIV
jgi:hypothetical protein